MRLELWAAGERHPTTRPQGWFLSRVVGPMYRSIRKEMNRKGPRNRSLGHTQKCNYDDFNEFFWREECLNYTYYTSEEAVRHPAKRCTYHPPMRVLFPVCAAVATCCGRSPGGFREVRRKWWNHANARCRGRAAHQTVCGAAQLASPNMVILADPLLPAPGAACESTDNSPCPCGGDSHLPAAALRPGC